LTRAHMIDISKSKNLSLTICGIGCLLIILGILFSQSFATNHLSPDGVLKTDTIKQIQHFRVICIFLGVLTVVYGGLEILLASILKITSPSEVLIFNVINHIPIKTMLKILLFWCALVCLNCALIRANLNPGTPHFFPISAFSIKTHFSGLLSTILFLIVFFISLKYSVRFNMLHVWIIGLTLIILGNLAQGSVDTAFYKPFYELNIPYYHDATQITDWRAWLSSFNINQPELSLHSRTHPPFAVILHYFVLIIGSHKSFITAGLFILLSTLSIILIWQIMKSLRLHPQQCSQLALLFSVIPAFNIYSALSLDGIIATTCTISLLGMVKIVNRGVSLSGTLLFIGGILLTNLLTFGGTFLVATACLIAMRNYHEEKVWDINSSVL